MKIDSSAIIMSSSRAYAQAEQTKTTLTKIEEDKGGNTASQALELNEFFANVSGSEEFLVTIGDSGSKPDVRSQIEENSLNRLRNRLFGEGVDVSKLKEEQEMSLVEQILNAFDKASGKKGRFRPLRRQGSSFKSMEDFSFRMQSLRTQFQGIVPTGSFNAVYDYTQTSIYMETEATSFTAQGVARTADGREISFNVDVAMTREFIAKSSYTVQLNENFQLEDPLVINMDADVASVRDQKFIFDINADGKADHVSRLDSSSGFLALDKNGNGRVDDGSELFGSRTGDGFKELAAYDGDGNGWIDENDAVFDDLQVWIQDEDGSNRLVSLAKADVGAIYLGSASTDFSLTDSFNGTNAVIRRSGVYLKESGGVGTVQHVDFAI